MRNIFFVLFGLAALVTYAYIGILTYLFIVGRLPHKAAFLGTYGVVIGLFAMAGVSIASSAWKATSYAIAACALCIAGLVNLMKWNGDLTSDVLGPYTPFLNLGVYLGILLGVGFIAMTWLDDIQKRDR